MTFQHFYYSISWSSPRNISARHVFTGEYIVYVGYGTSWLRCFNTTNLYFDFHKALGFRRGGKILFAVVAKTSSHHTPTIYNVSDILTGSGVCPVKPRVRPLPNEEVDLGSRFTF